MRLTKFGREPRSSISTLFALTFLVCLHCASAHAADIDDAQEAAVKFLDKVGKSQFKSAWDSDISQWFKQKVTREAFLANVTVTRAQLGGSGNNRELVQRNTAAIPPGGEIPGPIYSFMFSTTYPAAKVYESVALIKEDGEFVVSGFNFVPNPN